MRRHFARAIKNEASLDAVLGYAQQLNRFVIECTDYRNKRVALHADATTIEILGLTLERAGVRIEPAILAMVESDRVSGTSDGAVHHLSDAAGIYRYCIFDHPNERVLPLNQLLARDFPMCAPVIFRPDASLMGWSVTVYGQQTNENMAFQLIQSALEKGLIPARTDQRQCV